MWTNCAWEGHGLTEPWQRAHPFQMELLIIGRTSSPNSNASFEKCMFFPCLCQLDNLILQTAFHYGKHFLLSSFFNRHKLPAWYFWTGWGELRWGKMQGHFLGTERSLNIASWVCKNLARPARAADALSLALCKWPTQSHPEVLFCCFLALSMHFVFASSSCLPPDTF